MNSLDILNKAIDRLETHPSGWRTGYWSSMGEPACALGHLRWAAGDTFRFGRRKMDIVSENRESYYEAAKALRSAIPVGTSVMAWNDADAKNVGNVIAVFKKARTKLEKKYEQTIPLGVPYVYANEDDLVTAGD